MKLHELKPNQKARIISLNLEQIPMKLIEMGCLPGNQVELILKAPLGDPYYFNVDGTHLCIRKELAMQVSIEPLTLN